MRINSEYLFYFSLVKAIGIVGGTDFFLFIVSERKPLIFEGGTNFWEDFWEDFWKAVWEPIFEYYDITTVNMYNV